MSDERKTTITRLRVKNFRSLGDVEISFEPLTVLVGPNGSGKSNVIDVLRFIRDALSRGLDSAILDRNGMSALRRWSPKGAPYDVHIHLDISNPEWSAEYGFILGSKRREEYEVKWEKVLLKQKSDKSKSVKTSIIELKCGEIIDISNDIKKFLNVIPLAPFKTSLLFSSTMILAPLYTLWRFLRDLGFYTIYPDTIRRPQSPANPYPLNESGENLASMLRDLKRQKRPELQEMLKALHTIVEGITDYSVQQVGGYLVTKLHHTPPEGKDRSPTFPLAQESDGTLRMIGILAALYQVPYRSLLAIEEPELTIHPGAVGVLCDVLQEARQRGQVIVTTHSPELISHFPAEVFRITEKSNGITHVGPIKESQKEAIKEKLFSPGELLVMEGLQREPSSLESE